MISIDIESPSWIGFFMCFPQKLSSLPFSNPRTHEQNPSKKKTSQTGEIWIFLGFLLNLDKQYWEPWVCY